MLYSPDTQAPSPRYGHTAVVFGTCMYIFGGFDKDGFACNELFEYNFGTVMDIFGRCERSSPASQIRVDGDS